MSSTDAREDFENFTHSVSAARLLMTRAHAAGSLIEGLVLYASVIDALLRMLVAHATAERTGSVKHLDLRYFVHDKTLLRSERQLYKAALDHGVVEVPEFDELSELYDFRNVVIHRLIISGITYDEIGPQLDRYERIFEKLRGQLAAIERPDLDELTDDQLTAIRARISRKTGGLGDD